MQPLLLTEDEIRALTGYRQHSRQLRWLSEQLKIKAAIRADGLPIVTRAQLESAVNGRPVAAPEPNWSKRA
jgi:hypothetical protein